MIAHPDKKTVLPLAPEPIVKQHNVSKNDCKLNVAKRLLPKIRALYPKRKIIIAADGLPLLKLLKELKLDYILVAREGDHTHLFNEYAKRHAAGKTEPYTETEQNIKQDFCCANGLSLNATHPEIKVNLLKFSHADDNREIHWLTKDRFFESFALFVDGFGFFPDMRSRICWRRDS